jgi:hypothetical protein
VTQHLCLQLSCLQVAAFAAVPDKVLGDSRRTRLTSGVHLLTLSPVPQPASLFWLQVAAFTAVLDKDLSDRRRTAEIDVAPLLGDSYAARIQVQMLARTLNILTSDHATWAQALLLPGHNLDAVV